jgi:hypothetical protein
MFSNPTASPRQSHTGDDKRLSFNELQNSSEKQFSHTLSHSYFNLRKYEKLGNKSKIILVFFIE